MAKPQLENGRVEIALDLFVAIMTADLTNREMIVLTEVLLKCYGPMKQRDVGLDRLDIEHYTGLERANASRAIVGLVDRGILVRCPGGAFRFNKDYESWQSAGVRFGDRLSGGLLRFARSALERFGHPIKPSKKARVQRDSRTPSIQSPVGLYDKAPLESNGTRPNAYASSPLNGVSQGMGATSGNAQVSPPDLKTLRIELNTTPPKGGESEGGGGGATSNPRNPDDAADIASAVGVLKASPTTRDLADELARKHDRNGNLRSIEGWRFLVAAGELRRAKAGAVGMGLLVTKAREASRADLGALVAPRRPAEVLPEVLRADPNSPAVLANARLKARALKDERNPI